MKNKRTELACWHLLASLLIMTSCNLPSKPEGHERKTPNSSNPRSGMESDQIGTYVIEIMEDSKGNLWFGTIANGVAKYDGEKLIYLTAGDGLGDNRVASIAEDKEGNLWFATHSGIVKYDGRTYTNFSTDDGICDNRVSNLLVGKTGILWIGTWGGVCTYDGKNFRDFPLPNPDVNIPHYQETTEWLTEIFEDSQGNIWFARDGYGACKYDGQLFTHFTTEDGLTSNTLRDIQEDAKGNFWFGSRVSEKDHPDAERRNGSGGLAKYDGEVMTHFPNFKGLNKDDVYEVYRDTKENIWVGTIDQGVYRFDGLRFTNYGADNNDGLFPKPITNILEDRKGNIWLGCAGGLFRIEGQNVINVTVAGPW